MQTVVVCEIIDGIKFDFYLSYNFLLSEYITNHIVITIKQISFYR